MTQPGVLCCGSIVLDILVCPVERLVFDTSLWVDSIEQRLGGNGASTSCALAMLGAPVRLLGVVGNDGSGAYALARLKDSGCDVNAVAKAEGLTATSVVVVNAAGARMLLHSPGVSAAAFENPVEFSPALTGGLSHFHLANLFALPRLRRHAAVTVARARAAGLSVSIDTGWDSQGRWLEDLGTCLPSADFLFVNADEARLLTGAGDPFDAARKLCEMGARAVVVKLGPDGCLVRRADGQFTVPAFDVPAIDTTGAGDCFAGGFLAAIGRGESIEAAARFANAVAALSVQRLGAIEGLRTYGGTVEWARTAAVRMRS